MQEIWESYMKPIEGRPAMVAFNAEATDSASAGEFGVLGYVKVRLRFPTGKGFVDDAESDGLGFIEDQLEMEALRYRIGKYVGRILSNGEVHFIFYLRYDFEWSDVVGEAMRHFPQYGYECGSRMDTEWEVYRNLLSPTEREWQMIHNHRTCDRLRAGGDDLQQRRAIEHRAFFETSEGRRNFASAIAEEGFSIQGELSPTKERPWFGLQFYRIDSPHYYDIDALTLSLIELGVRFGGQYDGWETSLVRS